MNELEILKNFLLDKDIEILSSKLKEFNPLRVMKIEDYEIRHSNIIAWLFDPSENHGLGDTIIKNFLLEVLLNNNSKLLPISSVYSLDFHNLEVFREFKNIDIFIKIESGDYRIAVLIENKIKSKESGGQLKKYIQLIKDEFPNHVMMPIFLTLYGSDPSDDTYLKFSHEDFCRLLKNTLNLKKSNINQRVVDFIDHYLNSMEITLMSNEDIVKLCKEIYKNHKEAIDLIYDHAEVTTNLDKIIDKFKENKDLEIFRIRRDQFFFLPNSIKTKLKEQSHYWVTIYPLTFWFALNRVNDKLSFIFEIGPCSNQEYRKNFLKYLVNKNINIKATSLETESQYTRIFSKNTKFSNWDDEHDLINKMNELYDNINNDTNLKNIIETVKEYNW